MKEDFAFAWDGAFRPTLLPGGFDPTAFREGCATNNASNRLPFGGGVLYRFEATSPEGFVQQLAVSYMVHGYWYYVTGSIPAKKDPRAVDQKLIARYRIGLSKWSRARRKQAGGANVQYLRYERFFVLLATTQGHHHFLREEQNQIKDARKSPIRFHGYSISYRGGHAHVRIEQEVYNDLKAYFMDIAPHRRRESLERELGQLPYEPYAPIRRQLLSILRAVNETRRRAGHAPVEDTCFRFKRRIYRPFEPARMEEVA